MIGNLISDLEAKQAQFRDFGALITKILLQGEKDRETILRLLTQYISHNPDIEIVDVRKIQHPAAEWKISKDTKAKELAYLIRVSFKCSWCKNKTEEEANLSCFWSPPRSEGQPICSNCADDARDRAHEAAADDYYAEEAERKRKEKQEDIDWTEVL